MASKEQKELRAKWVAALRSGEFEQGHGTLHLNGRYCCLGVGARIAGFDLSIEQANLDSVYIDFRDAVGLQNNLGHFEGGGLALLNDRGVPFSEIADIIESEPDGLFKD